MRWTYWVPPRAWVRKPNAAPFLGGASALDRMLGGQVADLFVVYRRSTVLLAAAADKDAPRSPTQAQWGAKNPSAESLRAMDWWREFTAGLNGAEIITGVLIYRGLTYLLPIFVGGFCYAIWRWMRGRSG
mgnify:CR=1 FL=1